MEKRCGLDLVTLILGGHLFTFLLQFATTHEISHFYEVSAKTGYNVSEAFFTFFQDVHRKVCHHAPLLTIYQFMCVWPRRHREQFRKLPLNHQHPHNLHVADVENNNNRERCVSLLCSVCVFVCACAYVAITQMATLGMFIIAHVRSWQS